jgi:hypothetical protein
MDEVSHLSSVSFLDFGPSRDGFLVHSHTGERVRVGGGLWRLAFSDAGMAYLRPLQGNRYAAIWANDVFNKSLHMHGDVYSVYSKSDKTTTVLEANNDSVEKVFKHECSGGRCFRAEIYAFSMPKTCQGDTLFWVLPYIQDYVWGQDLHNRWICRNFKSWQAWLSEIGFEDVHLLVRQSLKSKTASAKHYQVEVPAASLLSRESEFSIASSAMVPLLAAWACNAQMKKNTISETNAAALLKVLLDAVLGRWTFWIMTPGKTLISIEDGKVNMHSLGALLPSLKRRANHMDQLVAVDEVLIHLVAMWKCSRARDRVGEAVIQDLIQGLSIGVKNLLECCDDLPCWLQSGHASLPVLHFSTSRPRRISISKKVALAVEVASSPVVKNKQQILAVENVIAVRDGLSPPMKAKSAARFSKATMFQYWIAGRSLFQDLGHVSLACDGGRVAGFELEIMGIYSQEKEVGMWCPPQVHQ